MISLVPTDRAGVTRQMSQETTQGDNEGHKGSPAKDSKGETNLATGESLAKMQSPYTGKKSVGSVGVITSEMPALSLFPRHRPPLSG